MRLSHILVASLASLVTGAFVFTAIHLVRSPSMWFHKKWMVDFGVGGMVIYALVPISALAILAAVGRRPSTVLSLLISVCWLLLIFLLWALKPIQVNGEFPWLGFQQHFLGMLPVPLSFAMVFSLYLRRYARYANSKSNLQCRNYRLHQLQWRL
jgi:hypothetical protein